MTLRRQAKYFGGLIAIVSGIVSIAAWLLPSSGSWLIHWLNRHGFIAWPIAVISLILFAWAAYNWRISARGLSVLTTFLRKPVPEDQRLYGEFKQALPKDSPTLVWLRTSADETLWRWGSVEVLSNFARDWRDSGKHYLNDDLEKAAQRLVESALNFLSFQATNSEADRKLSDGDTMYRIVYDYSQGNSRREREVQIGRSDRVDKVLAAYDELYITGSRLGL